MAGLVVTRGSGSTRYVVTARSSVLGSVGVWCVVLIRRDLVRSVTWVGFDQDEYVVSGRLVATGYVVSVRAGMSLGRDGSR